MTDATIEHRPRTLSIRALAVEVVSGPNAGAVHHATSDKMSIGTAEHNDLVLSDETVSRFHLELKRHEGRIRLRDLDSTNRTIVGPAHLGWADVEPGTIVKMGRTEVRILNGEPVAVDLIESEDLFGLRGHTASMRILMKRAERAAASDASVLIEGETGTGKELLARAIHASSPRADGPFETVDCGALLHTLVLSELFGHEPGAFTGAIDRHIGAFERAHGGTIFLDEIGELPSDLQPALLGALERRSFRRVGGPKPIEVDVRVVCATNRDLRQAVNARTFREDLYYRIGVVTLCVPPLRDRTADVPLLASYFARRAGSDQGIEAILAPAEFEAMTRHRWPGNVRELRNFVEAALAMGEPPTLTAPKAASGTTPPEETIDETLNLPHREARAATIEKFETRYLAHLMERSKGNVTEAARTAGLNRSYLSEMLKRHKIR